MKLPEELSTKIIIHDEEIQFDQPLVIAGFSGAGIVGAIAVKHIIESLEMKEIGYICSALIPPVTVFMDGILRHPYRIHASLDGKIIAIIFEYPIPNQAIVLNDVSAALSDYVDSLASCQFIVFEGLPSVTVPSDRTVYAVAEQETLDHLEEFDIPMLEKGILMGITGALMNDALIRDLCGITLLVSALRDIPDPEGAMYLVEASNKAFEQLDVSLESLKEKSDTLREKLEEIAAHAKRELIQEPSKPHYGDFR
jgi:uncharacterized protein